MERFLQGRFGRFPIEEVPHSMPRTDFKMCHQDVRGVALVCLALHCRASCSVHPLDPVEISAGLTVRVAIGVVFGADLDLPTVGRVPLCA